MRPSYRSAPPGAITVVAAVISIDLVIDVNYARQTVVNTLNGLSGAVALWRPEPTSRLHPGGTLSLSGTNATSSSTANTIVRRDGSGGFGAGTVTLSGNLVLPVTSDTVRSDIQSGDRLLHTFGTDSVFLGRNSGNFTATGSQNTAIGFQALTSTTGGGLNTASGANALLNNTSNANTAIGAGALQNNTEGGNNRPLASSRCSTTRLAPTIFAVGAGAGQNLTSGSNNIDIGNFGVAGEANTIRIGTAQTRAFLAGVRGRTTGATDGLTVLIDSNGQLGTISSSASAKKQIADIGDSSSPLLNLRPVSFLYRNDSEDIRQYGLIAEEVAQVMPELVQFWWGDRAETVRYHFLAPLLLNELQKQQQRNEEQEIEDRRVAGPPGCPGSADG